MEQLLCICAVLGILAALMLSGQGIAHFISSRINMCAPCLTFWLTNALLFGALAIAHNLTLNAALFVVIFAFINFFYIKTKIQIYE